MKKLIVIILSVLFFAPPLYAAKYVKEGGSGSGSSWSDAYDDLPGTLTRGETYYIADGNYSSYTFDDAGSSVITIKKCATGDGVCENADGYSSTDHDGQAVFGGSLYIKASYITIDGSVGGGPTAWDSGHGIKVESGYIGTADTTISNLSVSHVEIDQNRSDNSSDGTAVYLSGPGISFSNIYFGYCWMHDVGGGDVFKVKDVTTITVEYSCFSGAFVGGTGHPDLMQLYGGDMTGLIFRYSKIEDIDATYYWGAHSSGDDELINPQIYGNIIDITTGAVSNGVVAGLSGGGTVSGMKFYNNIITGVFTDGGSVGFSNLRGSGNVAYNNLWHRTSGTGPVGWSTATHDDNAFYNYTSDEDNYSGTPINSDYTLTEAAVAEMAAGRTLVGYETDMFGTTRGADGTWDRGAFEYDEGGGTPTTTTITGLEIR